MLANRQPVRGRSAWRPADFPTSDAYSFNNCTVLHHRTSFEDHPDPARKRHLLRLWLMLDGLRPLAAVVHAYKGTAGIEGHAGSSTYCRGRAL